MTRSRDAEFQSLSLDEQIDARRTDIRSDKLDITYGEFANMYDAGELIVEPAYQRLFRWKPPQKTRFLESILLGIPTPAIFVAETQDAVWELVDGLQRISTILEFFGVLRNADGEPVPPSVLAPDTGAALPGLDGMSFHDLSLRSRLSIRRAGCRVEVVKVGSGRRMKYDVFERLNTGGTQLTAQEIRNCVFRAESPELMAYVDTLAEMPVFKDFLDLSETQMKSLYDRGLVLRFFALKNDLNSFRHHVDPFITDYMHKIVDGDAEFDFDSERSVFERTMKVITEALGRQSWRHSQEGRDRRVGAFSVYVFEALAVSAARHLEALEQLPTGRRAEVLTTIKNSDKFRAAVGSGANTRPRLVQRLDAAEEVIRAAVDDEEDSDGEDTGK